MGFNCLWAIVALKPGMPLTNPVRNATTLGGLVIVGLAIFVTGCAESKASTSLPAPPTVVVAPVVQKDVPLYIEALGSLDGYVDADIRARVRGILAGQRYQDGATVKPGQLLFNIDRSEFQIAVSSARAALARAETALAHNKALLARRTNLGAAKVVSQQEVEDAEAAARDAEDQVRAAKAQLQQAELNLSYTDIRSPVGGLAGLAQVRSGNLVGQDGPTLLTTVSQVNPMRVNFPMSEIDYLKAAERLKRIDGRDLAWAEKQFAAMKNGNTIEGALDLILSDGTIYPQQGLIVAVNRQVDTTTGTIQLQALFPNPDNLLRPGQYGRVRMRRTDAGANALLVPEKALIQVQGSYSLAVVGPGNKVALRRVEVGPVVGASRIIISGISAGEQVVAEGVQKVSDGIAVVPQVVAAMQPTGAASLPAPH
jgi:membrane fusion protein (multidrug efflux system)